MDLAAALVTLVTLVAGLAAGWALAASRAADVSSTARAASATAAAERDAAVAERDRLRAEREVMMGALRDADARVATAAAKLEALQQNDDQIKDTFARMSSEALQRSSTQFLELADERFKQAGAPLTETLTKVEDQLREIEKDRMGAQQAMSQQIEFVRTTGEAIRTETASLVSALRKPQTRGQWGELQLRRCVEFAGMTDRCDFTEQASVTTADGVLRPDMVIRLVGGKNVVVDSKVTLSAFLEAHDATDDDVREERLVAHAKHLRQHVDQLAAKTYWAQFSPSPEFVIMFVPSDALLSAALDRDPALLEDAITKRVHIVTPMSLISTLRTIAYAWQQDALAANAQEVFELGRELYTRLGAMGGHVDKLGRSLTRAVADYNSTVGSLESKVLVTARKLNTLRIIDTDLSEATGLDATVRPLTKPELLESADDARSVVALPAVMVEVTDTDEIADRANDYGLGAAGPADGQAAQRR